MSVCVCLFWLHTAPFAASLTLKKKKEAKMQNTLLELPQEQPLIMAGKRKKQTKDCNE